MTRLTYMMRCIATVWWPETSAKSDGASMIAAERQRQISSEGWTPEHDDEHDSGEMADAARAYIFWPFDGPCPVKTEAEPPSTWPWDESWWNPKDRISNLVRAGALIAAEIDRLQRAAGHEVAE